MKKLTNEKFIEKARKIHGYKYEYNNVKYVNNRTPVKIYCPEHGFFDQIASNHLSGKGCLKCSGVLVNNKKDFEFEARKIHGDKYGYESVNYVKSIIKVKIICREHGEFEQSPNIHLRGAGCSKCIGRLVNNKKDFEIKSKKIHNNKYGYESVNYVNTITNVKINCPEHGYFYQTPKKHTSGHGCPKCNGGLKSSTQEFIKKAKKIHNDKYDYSSVEYINAKSKVKIYCKKHDFFYQIAYDHLSGRGCPTCGHKPNDRDLYLFYDEKYNLMKIGISNNPEKRLKDISKNENREGLIILKIFEKSGLFEGPLHKEYVQFRTKHILYNDGKTEWFKLNKNEVINIEKFIKNYKFEENLSNFFYIKS